MTAPPAYPLSPQDFLRVADLMAEPALLVSASGKVLAATRNMAALHLPPAQLSGKPLETLVADDPEQLRQYLRLCGRTSHPVVGGLRFRDAQGTVIACRCHGALVYRDPAGEQTQLMLRLACVEKRQDQFAVLNEKIASLNEEIRQRRRAEASLREQTDWLRVTLASIGDAVVTTDPQGRVTFLNPLAEKLMGVSSSEAKGRPLCEVFHIVNEFTREVVESPVEKVIREGGVVGMANHTVLIRSDGTELPIDDSAAPIRDASNRVNGVVLVFRDVTERHRRDAELREHREWLQVTLNSIADGVIATDPQGVVTFVNREAQRLTGWDLAEALGRSVEEVFQLVGEKTGAARPSPTAEVLEKGQVIGLAEDTVLVARDGTRRSIDDSAAPMRNLEGAISGAVLVFRDATARRLAEKTLRERAEELTEADRRKNEFLAMLSHELRNPLAPIRSGLELLAREQGDSEPIRLMQRQVQHLVRLVDELLDVSRIVRGRVDLRRSNSQLQEILAAAIETVQPIISERNHRFSVTMPPNPVWLNADPVRLAQVFTNLLHNAAKYSDSGSQIALKAALQNQGVEVRVRDTGSGIDPELLPQIFDLFTQSERTIDRSLGGLGLGLTLVKTLVEMHNGSVAAYSAGPGAGSEFVVQLPIISEPISPQTASTEPDISSNRTVLIVDDNVGAAKMLRMLLISHGLEQVYVAHDGVEGIAAARRHQPDCILLDIGLPRLDGYEVARQLRAEQQFRDTLLVAITGYGQEEDIERSRAAGFNEHLVKPPQVDALLRLLSGKPIP